MTVITFINGLAQQIFGSEETASFIRNRSDIRTNIENLLVSIGGDINDTIDANGSTYALVTSSSSTGYKTVKYLHDSISTTDRLKLYYNYSATVTLPASTFICKLDDAVNNAGIRITMDSNSEIIELDVCCAGSNYVKGDSVTFTDGTYSIYFSSITSYQAAGFNDALETSDIELPFEVGDIITIPKTISSSINEVDASGDAITTSIVVGYSIKLV